MIPLFSITSQIGWNVLSFSFLHSESVSSVVPLAPLATHHRRTASPLEVVPVAATLITAEAGKRSEKKWKS